MKEPASEDYKLIKELSAPTNPDSKNKPNRGNAYKYKPRENFSFATKFCHYMAMYLFDGKNYADNFSIYDNVLDKAIRKYADDKEPC